MCKELKDPLEDTSRQWKNLRTKELWRLELSDSEKYLSNRVNGLKFLAREACKDFLNNGISTSSGTGPNNELLDITLGLTDSTQVNVFIRAFIDGEQVWCHHVEVPEPFGKFKGMRVYECGGTSHEY